MNFDPKSVAIWWVCVIIVLSYVGFLLLVGLSAVVAALKEKRYVRNFVPLDMDGRPPSANDPGPHPYMDLANELTGQLGFEFGGIFARAKKGATRFRVALWRSPERDTLVTIFIGEAGGPLHMEVTFLVSHIGNRYLITTDDFGEDDISGLLVYEVLPRRDFLQSLDEEVHQQAHFQKLLARHEDRLREWKGKPILFQAKDMSEDLNTMRMEHARHMVELGYAEFLDNEHTVWRYTPKGAATFFFRSYLKQLLISWRGPSRGSARDQRLENS
jgi:hypothetical protein